jgi:uncharacterized protein (UPF0332 family)
MSFDWREYFNLAKFLSVQPGDGFAQEAALRSAVSRAYYAAYCHALGFARVRHGFRPRGTADDHADLVAHFRGRGDVQTSKKLERLRDWRNQCDYDDVVQGIKHLLGSAMQDAEQVLQSLP